MVIAVSSLASLFPAIRAARVGACAGAQGGVITAKALGAANSGCACGPPLYLALLPDAVVFRLTAQRPIVHSPQGCAKRRSQLL
jgi:hypothetical protein